MLRRVDFDARHPSYVDDGIQIARPSPLADRRRSMTIQKITPFLWYATEAEEAAAFYAGIFPDSRIVRVTAVAGTGGTRMVEFELFGQPFIAMSHPRTDTFNHAISLMISCGDQAELDRYWSALLDNGGTADGCGWLRDRFGVSWQIVPRQLVTLLGGADRARAKRAFDAMMQMKKIDIAELDAAVEGVPQEA